MTTTQHYNSLVQMAANYGFGGKTHAGAKRFLLSRLTVSRINATRNAAITANRLPSGSSYSKIEAIGRPWFASTAIRAESGGRGRPDAHRRARLDRGGETRCRLLGLPLRNEAFESAVAAGDYAAAVTLRRDLIPGLAESARTFGVYAARAISLSAAAQRAATNWDEADTVIRLTDTQMIILSRDEHVEWDRSRSGRKSWPSSRQVTRTAYLIEAHTAQSILSAPMVSPNYGGISLHNCRIVAQQQYEARGNWLLRVAAILLHIETRKDRAHANVQLDPHFIIQPIRDLFGVSFFRRMLGGYLYDFCAVAHGATYHAETQRAALRGLAGKLAAPGSKHELIDYAACRVAGFCREGIQSFCDQSGLDIHGAYSRNQVRAALTPDLQYTYRYELVKLGIIHRQEEAA